MSGYASPTLWGNLHSVWTAGALLGEGTLWSQRQQALFWVDILGHQLHRYKPATQSRDSWKFDEEISAVAEREDTNEMLVTLRRDIALFHLETGYLQRLCCPEPDRPGNRFNDGKCDAQGRFWGGTMDFGCVAPTGALYRFEAQGHCTQMQAGFAVTNGPTWSLDGRTLYLGNTVEAQVHAFECDPATGALGASRVWLQMSPDDGLPDGMTTDAEGRIWIAHWGGSCVTCHDLDSAAELLRIPLPVSQVTNCAFGGPDLQSLFISTARGGLIAQQQQREPLAGALFCVGINSPGLAAPLFAG